MGRSTSGRSPPGALDGLLHECAHGRLWSVPLRRHTRPGIVLLSRPKPRFSLGAGVTAAVHSEGPAA